MRSRYRCIAALAASLGLLLALPASVPGHRLAAALPAPAERPADTLAQRPKPTQIWQDSQSRGQPQPISFFGSDGQMSNREPGSNLSSEIEPPIIISDEMDPRPNVPLISPPDNRFEVASYEESLGNNETALDSFKEILNDKLDSEKQFWSICIDKVYNLSLILEEDINALLNYYEILYQTTQEYLTEEEKRSLQWILKNYQKKCHIEKNEYQQAADIVIERINDPISTLDSLFAVMQLETIYMLSYSDSTGRGNSVVTSYDKLAPKTLKEHNQKHKDHWNEIYNLLGFGDNDELEQNLPPVPILSGNYPNPFNPETKIVFSIPEDSKVNLSIYNIKGQKVKTLINGNQEKGFHNIIWNSKDNNGKSVASGVYFYKFDVNGKTKGVKKMLLLK